MPASAMFKFEDISLIVSVKKACFAFFLGLAGFTGEVFSSLEGLRAFFAWPLCQGAFPDYWMEQDQHRE